jgi:hypothetical protein
MMKVAFRMAEAGLGCQSAGACHARPAPFAVGTAVSAIALP